MDRTMRMILVAGVLMVALLVAVVGSVGADSISFEPAVADASKTLVRPL